MVTPNDHTLWSDLSRQTTCCPDMLACACVIEMSDILSSVLGFLILEYHLFHSVCLDSWFVVCTGTWMKPSQCHLDYCMCVVCKYHYVFCY